MAKTRSRKKQGKQGKQRKTQRGGRWTPPLPPLPSLSTLSQVLPTGNKKKSEEDKEKQQKCLRFFVKEDKVCDINTLKDCRATIENMLKTQPELYPFYVIMKGMIKSA
jgi:hypothetical protein